MTLFFKSASIFDTYILLYSMTCKETLFSTNFNKNLCWNVNMTVNVTSVKVTSLRSVTNHFSSKLQHQSSGWEQKSEGLSWASELCIYTVCTAHSNYYWLAEGLYLSRWSEDIHSGSDVSLAKDTIFSPRYRRVESESAPRWCALWLSEASTLVCVTFYLQNHLNSTDICWHTRASWRPTNNESKYERV